MAGPKGLPSAQVPLPSPPAVKATIGIFPQEALPSGTIQELYGETGWVPGFERAYC